MTQLNKSDWVGFVKLVGWLHKKILMSYCITVLSNVSKFIIFVCVLIKYYVCFDKCLSSVIKCVQFCSKVNFITNITNSIRIHIFYFYNNKYTVINTDTIFTIKQTNFIKINKNPRWDLSVPLPAHAYCCIKSNFLLIYTKFFFSFLYKKKKLMSATK